MEEKQKCEICGGEFKNLGVHMKAKHETPGPAVPTIPDDGVKEAIVNLTKVLGSVDERLSKLEEKKEDAFRKGVTAEDVQSAKLTRSSIDPKISKIVDETLGEDFGVEIEPRKGQPGFLFTIIVPQRLSDVKVSSRPVVDAETGDYKKYPSGVVIEEEFWPQDRRSRMIGSHQSYDSIREHAVKVRAYIVAYFQKMSQPIPEFKLRANSNV